MSGLLLPPSAVFNEQRDRVLERANGRRHALQALDEDLRALDPYLSLVKAGPAADAPGVKPGHWHVRRRNPIGLDSYMVIEDEHGGFMEPHHGIVESLRRSDLHNPEVFRRLTGAQEREQRALDARRAEASAEAADELAGRLKAKLNPGVSFRAVR